MASAASMAPMAEDCGEMLLAAESTAMHGAEGANGCLMPGEADIVCGGLAESEARDVDFEFGGPEAGPRRWALLRLLALGCGGLLAALALCRGLGAERLLPALRGGALTLDQEPVAQAGRRSATGTQGLPWGCGMQHEDRDYQAPIIKALPRIPNERVCRQHCVNNTHCMAWTYGKRPGEEGFSRVCVLKSLMQDDLPPKMEERSGVVSGTLPCHMEGTGTLPSLFCFTVARESTDEKRILQLQFKERVGVFACDSLALYSNRTFEVGPGVWTSPVPGGLRSGSGGEVGFAQNLEIALSVWQDVARSRIYEDHDWTVKTAVDAVFLPQRLRALIPHHPEDVATGVYLNNCRYNLRGPIEVLSRAAVGKWIRGVGACFQKSAQTCRGPCGWGEAVFLDQCLQEVLGARRDDEWRLLKEDQCPGRPEPTAWTPEACTSDHVAFHPFPTVEGFSRCLSISKEASLLHPS